MTDAATTFFTITNLDANGNKGIWGPIHRRS